MCHILVPCNVCDIPAFSIKIFWHFKDIQFFSLFCIYSLSIVCFKSHSFVACAVCILEFFSVKFQKEISLKRCCHLFEVPKISLNFNEEFILWKIFQIRFFFTNLTSFFCFVYRSLSLFPNISTYYTNNFYHQIFIIFLLAYKSLGFSFLKYWFCIISFSYFLYMFYLSRMHTSLKTARQMPYHCWVASS